jgi:hypothetical protein
VKRGAKGDPEEASMGFKGFKKGSVGFVQKVRPCYFNLLGREGNQTMSGPEVGATSKVREGRDGLTVMEGRPADQSARQASGHNPYKRGRRHGEVAMHIVVEGNVHLVDIERKRV